MKKALIIGAAGFVGNYLIDHIQKNCIWSIAVTKMERETIPFSDIDIYDLDILDKKAVIEFLDQVRPDYIYHLAAQSSVALSWTNPDITVDVNIKGTLHVLDAIRELNYKPRVLLIGSGEEYGHVCPEEVPIVENCTLRPGNLYAATKACQNMIGKIYVDAYGMDIMSVRAFNHIGPNQAPLFVVADFCKQVAEMEAGVRTPIVMVGNLSAQRDFADVRDVVRAYVLLMEQGKAGETYNVGSGNAVRISEILEQIVGMSNCQIQVEVDQSKLRPVDVPIIEANIQKIQDCCGWECEITLETTLKETLEYWRKSISL